MTDRLGHALGNIVRKNSGFGVKWTVPAPPVLSPAIRSGSSIGSALAGQTPTPSPPPTSPQSSFNAPPPPTLSLGDALGRSTAQSVSMPRTVMPQVSTSGSTSVRMPGFTSLSTSTQEQADRVRSSNSEWGVYDVNGVNVAMPSWLADHNDFELTEGASLITDPDGINNMRNNHISYKNMPDEVTQHIKMPEEMTLGSQIGSLAQSAQRDLEDASVAERAEAMTSVAEAAVTGGLNNATGPTLEAREWNEEHAYSLINNRSAGTTELVRREELEAWDDDSYEVITSRVSEAEAQSIWDSGVLKGNREGPSTLDSTIETTRQDAINYDLVLDNARRLQMAVDQGGVVEIDGKHYPEGTESPIKYRPVTVEVGEDPIGSQYGLDTPGLTVVNQTVVEELPPAPDGWIWVHNGDEAWLTPEQYQRDGGLSTPAGSQRVQTQAELGDTWLARIGDTAANTFMSTLETGISWLTQGSTGLVPDSVKDWWDDNIQEPATNFLLEHVPEGRLRDAAVHLLENPVEGMLLLVSAPGDANVDLITQSVLYPGESKLDVIGSAQSESRIVKPYTDFLNKNPEQSRDIYENGYDSNGDGQVDLYGVEATMQWWYDEELAGTPGGSFTWLLFLTLTDPLTLAAGIGAGGSVVRGSGRSIRMRPNASRGTQRAGRIIEGTGRTLEVSGRIAEDLGDLGARYALNLIGRIGSRVNPRVSSALGQEAASSAQATISDLYSQRTSRTNTGIGTLEPDRATGRIIMRLNEANAATTGPNAQALTDRADISVERLDQLHSDAFGIETGDTVNVGRGATATRTEDGWEVTTQAGETTRSTTRAGAVEESQNKTAPGPDDLPERYVQREPIPGREPSYIDQMPRRLYESTIEDIGITELQDSVARQRRSSANEVPTILNLNETDRIGWLIKETAESIDPTFIRSWERNWNGGDTVFQLSESFRRADLNTALAYWGAMTGGGNTVPLLSGQPYRGTSPVLSLTAPRRNVTSPNHLSVQRANHAVDNIFARLKYHPGDVYDPRFAEIVRQAAVLDYNLRSRNLRSSGPGWTYDPITALIPDDAPIRLRKEVRDMAAYKAPAMHTDDAGEFITRVSLDRESGLGVDVYRVATESVPQEWVAYWADQFPDASSQEYWAQGIVQRSADESFTVYAPDTEFAVRAADETALARGWTDLGDPSSAVDHVTAVQGETTLQEATGSPQSAADLEVESVPAAGTPVAPNATQGVSGMFTQLRQMLDRLEGVEDVPGAVPSEAVTSVPTRPIAEIIDTEWTRTNQRMDAEAWAAWGKHDQPDGMITAKKPAPTGETVMDPTGIIEMPRYESAPTRASEPTSTASKPGQKILDDVMALADDSPRLRTLETKAGKPRAATHKAARSGMSVESTSEGYWLNRTIEDYQNQVLTEHPFPDGETLKDRITRYTVEAGDGDQWRRAMDMNTYIDEAIAKAWPEYEAHLYENVFQKGVLNNAIKAKIQALPTPVRWALEKAAVALRAPLKAYDHLARYYRERILFNWPKVWHYPATQYFGNMVLALLSGDLRVMAFMANPANVKRAFDTVKAGSPEQWWRETGIPTRTQVMHNRLGTTPADETRDVLRGRAFGQEGDKFIGQATLERTPGGRFTSKLLGSRFARDFGAAMDVVYRESLEYTTTVRNMRELFPDYRNSQINRLMDWLDIDQAEAARLWREFEDSTGNRWEFSYDDVVEHFAPILGNGNARVGSGRAERMGRDWRQTLSKNQNAVRGVIQHRAMAQGQTRVDLVAQRLLAFHYFQSRQWWFMVNQMATHPFLINIYFNAMEELERLAEDNGWPSYMKNWVKLMSGPGGRDLFWNPFALLSAYNLFDQDNTFRYDQEGEHRNQLEGWIYDWTGFDIDLQDIGLNPVIDKAINVTGLAGDTWSPDLLQVGRESSILTLAINTGRAWGWIGDDPRPVGDANEDINRDIREGVTSTLNRLFPDTFDTVESRSSEQTMDYEIRAIMSDELARQGIDPESDEAQTLIAEAEMNPDSDLYQKSLKRWILGEWFEQGARIVAGPLRPRTRLANADGDDLMLSLGENARRTVRTPEPKVTLFRQQASGYYEAGDRRGQYVVNIWTSIANGEVKGDITINGITYTEAEVNAMDREQRVAIANGLLAEYGILGEAHAVWEERDRYLAQPENADFAQYQTWSGAVRDYPGGPDQYWQDLIEGNPTAEAYYNTFIADESDPVVRQRAMVSQNAFFAIKGWDSYVFDKPTEAYGSQSEIWDPVGIANTQAQPIPYEESNAEFKNEVRQVPVFLHEMQVWDSHTDRKMQERGYPPGTSFSSLNSRTRRDIEEELEAEGIYEPSPSWQIERYLEWVSAQPAGSLDRLTEEQIMQKFFEENQQDYYDSLPGQTEERLNQPSPLPSPDPYGNTPASSSGGTFWQDLFNLLNEHDHQRYNDPWGQP